MEKLNLSLSKITPETQELIIYIAGAGSYSRLHLMDGERHLYSDSIVRYADRLPRFIRVHKHYLINPNFVESVTQIDSTHGYVTMVTGDQLPIARRRIPQVRKAIYAALARRTAAIRPGDSQAV